MVSFHKKIGGRMGLPGEGGDDKLYQTNSIINHKDQQFSTSGFLESPN
jgi:hypothetical protein